MTMVADLVLTSAEVHTLGSPDETHKAVAIRGDEVVRIGHAFDVGLLTGIETRVVDYGGCAVLPGFIDAHMHLPMVGRSLVHADLSVAGSSAEVAELLRERTVEVESDDETGDEAGWVLGYDYDKSMWDDSRHPIRDDLGVVSESRPVVTFREDVHTADVNLVVLDESPWEANSIRGIVVSTTTVDGRAIFERD